MRGLIVSAALAAALVMGGAAAQAQEAVVGSTNSEHMFTDKDPVKNRNKQAAYHIMKDLLEAAQWDKAGNWLTKAYHQHNPNAASGLDGVVYYFTQVAKVQAKPVPEKLGTPIVAVLADGDLVTVVTPRTLKDPKDPSKTYTTTWFDMWRFVDGKADEHWDGAEKR